MTICGCLFSEKRSKERTDLKYWTCFNEYLKIRTYSTTDKHVEILQQMTLTNLDHPSHLHAHQPGVGCSLAVEREAAPSPVHNHNIDILRSDQGRGHVLASDQWAFIRQEGLICIISLPLSSPRRRDPESHGWWTWSPSWPAVPVSSPPFCWDQSASCAFCRLWLNEKTFYWSFGQHTEYRLSHSHLKQPLLVVGMFTIVYYNYI